MKQNPLPLILALGVSAVAAGSADAAVVYDWNDVGDLDYANVVQAYNFTDSGSDLAVNGVTFSAYTVGNGVASNNLTINQALNGGADYQSGQGAAVTSGGSATDRANLTTIMNNHRNGLQGFSASSDMLLTVAGLANGTYKVQYLLGFSGNRTNTLFYSPETGSDIALGQWQLSGGAKRNILITGEVEVTDNNLDLVLGAVDLNNDERRLISGLIISAVPEPGSLALLGLGGLCVLQRRRR